MSSEAVSATGFIVHVHGLEFDGWRAGKLRTADGETVAFAGTCDCMVGESWTLHGSWGEYRGRPQIAVAWATKNMATDAEGIQKILEKDPRFKLIGPIWSRAIAKAAEELGDLSVVLADPEKTAALKRKAEAIRAEEVRRLEGPDARSGRIPRKAIRLLKEQWDSNRAEHETKASFIGLGLSPRHVDQLWKNLGPSGKAIIWEDPWAAISFGVPFEAVDRIALEKLKLDRIHPKRLEAGIIEALNGLRDGGHTWIARSQIVDRTKATLSIGRIGDREAVAQRLDELLIAKDERIVLSVLEPIGEVISPRRLYAAETTVATYFDPSLKDDPNPHFVNHPFDPAALKWLIEADHNGVTRMPNEAQTEALVKATQKKKIVITGPAGAGKAQPLDADVLTPTGYRKMGSIGVGDVVSTPFSGESAKVTGVFPQGEIEIYRVLFTDGTSTECSIDHLWATMTALDRDKTPARKRKARHYAPKPGDPTCHALGCSRGVYNNGYCHKHATQIRVHGRLTPELERATVDCIQDATAKDLWKVRSLKEILDTLITSNQKRNHSIPMVEPIDFEEDRSVAVDPYLLGLLLGDGSFRAGLVEITNASKAVIAFCRAWAKGNRMTLTSRSRYRWAFRLRKCGGPGYPKTHLQFTRRNSLRIELDRLGLWKRLAHEKFVPQTYLLSSAKTRLAVLQGLMDSDGTVSKSGTNASITTTSRQLACDIKFLIESLGGVATELKPRYTNYTYKGEKRTGRLSYSIGVSMPPELCPFRLQEERVRRFKPKTKYKPTRYLASIEFIGKKQAQCISIDHPSQLYVTNNFIVTHNTTVISALIKVYQSRNKNVALAAPTGKAAKRLFEVMDHAGKLSRPLAHGPATIHKLLECKGLGIWVRDRRNPLHTDVLIVDEASMCDAEIMYRVIDALGGNCALVLVGDPNQLPSVGPGAVLRDLVEGGRCEVARLDKVLRHAGVMRANARALLSGVMTGTTQEVGDDGLVFMDDGEPLTPWLVEDRHHNSVSARRAVARRFEDLLTEGGRGMILELQVLSPQYKYGVGIDNLNKDLQEIAQRVLYAREIKSQTEGEDKVKFLVGDKVVQTKNDYEIDLMNGMQGIVTEIDKKFVYLEIERIKGRPTTVAVPREASEGLKLAWALSYHRAQGSQWEHIIAACHSEHAMLSRKLIYTAATRATKSVTLIGDQGGLRGALMKTDTDFRRTFMAPAVLLERFAREAGVKRATTS